MKILFVQNGLLFPTNTGGRIRTLNVVRYLAQWHEVTYVCNVDPAERDWIAPMRDLGLRVEVVPRKPIHRNSVRFWWRLAANLFSGNPLRISKHYDPRLRRRVFELVRAGSFDLVICDFLHTAKHVEGL